ncbi:TonB-dependent receptor [Sphingomonas colocasiae]|uniref:TonB-dependent receptor n=1 Tax=Sphingomonas colocasiae TaxID=1848973 RepID=A0ABS7PS67_9SPHN|nr:TonB-dependent receptor [Sphingomonas colocasiae]MBY8824182.1 TonB-dependent receptor [Sphingomonas colocasiae]
MKSALIASHVARLFAAASLGVIAIGQAQAQAQTPQADAPAPENEDIIVTGFRASLNAALDVKRESIGVVDVIKAEDIADFPDNNLAESIQRIPGVAINRDQGEGRNISVRGLGPIFTRVRINGIEGLSTTGGSDASGGANRGRQFDFNTFASELFNSITVRKTASADVEEGSLGATVDLQTARPFDYKDDFTLAGSAAVGLNDFSNAVDPKLAGLVSAKFADGRIGVLLSAAYSERGIFEEGPSTVRWERGTDNGGFAPASTLPTGATQGYAFFAPRIPRYDSYRYSTKRLGLTGSIQWQPSDATLLTFDALYSNFKSNRAEQYLEAISFSRSGTGKPQTVIRPGAVVDATNSLVKGVFDNVDIRVESRYDELETEFQQYTLSLHQEFGDRLRLDLLGGYSKSDFSNPIQTTIALDANNVQGYSFDFTSGRNPIFNYGNLNVANAGAWTLGEIRLRPQYVQNDFKNGRFQFEYDATDAVKLRLGGDYKKYSFDSQEYRRASETAVPALAPGQLAGLTRLYSMSPDTPTNGTPSSFIIPNLGAFAEAFGIYSNSGIYALTGTNNSNAQGNWRAVSERDIGGYVQAVGDFDLGGMRLRGDVGVRYVDTRQRSAGYTGGALAVLVADERSYGEWLPSLNLSLELNRDMIVRGAVARVMTRPNLGNLNPTGAFSISGGNRTYNIGNPAVEPIIAVDYDLSFEWYFARESALVVGLFYKDISSFVANTAQSIPFNQLGLPDSLITGPNGQLLIQPTDLITVTQPLNSKGGTLKGLEVGFQTPFRFLPGFLSNLGVQANYTYVKSNIEYPLSTAAGAPVVIRPLTDLSKHSANATLYYEDKRFSLRGSVAYRSGYVQAGGVPGRNGVAPGAGPNFNPNAGQPTFNDVEGVHSTINVDMSASLKVTENVTLTFEAINLTDEYIDQYIDSAADRLSVYHHTGRQFYFGARFKF